MTRNFHSSETVLISKCVYVYVVPSCMGPVTTLVNSDGPESHIDNGGRFLIFLVFRFIFVGVSLEAGGSTSFRLPPSRNEKEEGTAFFFVGITFDYSIQSNYDGDFWRRFGRHV